MNEGLIYVDAKHQSNISARHTQTIRLSRNGHPAEIKKQFLQTIEQSFSLLHPFILPVVKYEEKQKDSGTFEISYGHGLLNNRERANKCQLIQNYKGKEVDTQYVLMGITDALHYLSQHGYMPSKFTLENLFFCEKDPHPYIVDYISNNNSSETDLVTNLAIVISSFLHEKAILSKVEQFCSPSYVNPVLCNLIAACKTTNKPTLKEFADFFQNDYINEHPNWETQLHQDLKDKFECKGKYPEDDNDPIVVKLQPNSKIMTITGENNFNVLKYCYQCPKIFADPRQFFFLNNLTESEIKQLIEKDLEKSDEYKPSDFCFHEMAENLYYEKEYLLLPDEEHRFKSNDPNDHFYIYKVLFKQFTDTFTEKRNKPLLPILLKHLKFAAKHKKEHSKARMELAIHYLKGEIVPLNYEKASKYLKSITTTKKNKDVLDSAKNLVKLKLRFETIAIQRLNEKQKEHFRKATDEKKKNPLELTYLAYCFYSQFDSFPFLPNFSVSCYREAAKQSPDYMCLLGGLYLKGFIFPRNKLRAKKCFERAAILGCHKAKIIDGLMRKHIWRYYLSKVSIESIYDSYFQSPESISFDDSLIFPTIQYLTEATKSRYLYSVYLLEKNYFYDHRTSQKYDQRSEVKLTITTNHLYINSNAKQQDLSPRLMQACSELTTKFATKVNITDIKTNVTKVQVFFQRFFSMLKYFRDDLVHFSNGDFDLEGNLTAQEIRMGEFNIFSDPTAVLAIPIQNSGIPILRKRANAIFRHLLRDDKPIDQVNFSTITFIPSIDIPEKRVDSEQIKKGVGIKKFLPRYNLEESTDFEELIYYLLQQFQIPSFLIHYILIDGRELFKKLDKILKFLHSFKRKDNVICTSLYNDLSFPNPKVWEIDGASKSESPQTLLDKANNYFDGINGYPVNYYEAASYYQKAADLKPGDDQMLNKAISEAKWKYAQMCANGLCIQQNFETAHKYFKESAELGNSEGLLRYGLFLLQRINNHAKKDKDIDFSKFITFIEKSAGEISDKNILSETSDFTPIRNESFNKQSESERQYLTLNAQYKQKKTFSPQINDKISDNEPVFVPNNEALHQLGILYESANTSKSINDAFSVYKKASENGHIESLFRLIELAEGNVRKQIRYENIFVEYLTLSIGLFDPRLTIKLIRYLNRKKQHEQSLKIISTGVKFCPDLYLPFKVQAAFRNCKENNGQAKVVQNLTTPLLPIITSETADPLIKERYVMTLANCLAIPLHPSLFCQKDSDERREILRYHDMAAKLIIGHADCLSVLSKNEFRRFYLHLDKGIAKKYQITINFYQPNYRDCLLALTKRKSKRPFKIRTVNNLLKDILNKNNSNPFALLLRGKIYLNAHFCWFRNPFKGIKLIKHAARLNCPEASLKYGKLLFKGTIIPAKYDKAIQCFRSAYYSENGDARAGYYLSKKRLIEYVKKKESKNKDPSQKKESLFLQKHAKKHFDMAVKYSYAPALLALGKWFHETGKSKFFADYYVNKAASQLHKKAVKYQKKHKETDKTYDFAPYECLQWGKEIYYARGLFQKISFARDFFSKAKEKGLSNGTAEFYLSKKRFISEGQVTRSKAKEYFNFALSQYNRRALFKLGKSYFNRDSITNDLKSRDVGLALLLKAKEIEVEVEKEYLKTLNANRKDKKYTEVDCRFFSKKATWFIEEFVQPKEIIELENLRETKDFSFLDKTKITKLNDLFDEKIFFPQIGDINQAGPPTINFPIQTPRELNLPQTDHVQSRDVSLEAHPCLRRINPSESRELSSVAHPIPQQISSSYSYSESESDYPKKPTNKIVKKHSSSDDDNSSTKYSSKKPPLGKKPLPQEKPKSWKKVDRYSSSGENSDSSSSSFEPKKKPLNKKKQETQRKVDRYSSSGENSDSSSSSFEPKKKPLKKKKQETQRKVDRYSSSGENSDSSSSSFEPKKKPLKKKKQETQRKVDRYSSSGENSDTSSSSFEPKKKPLKKKKQETQRKVDRFSSSGENSDSSSSSSAPKKLTPKKKKLPAKKKRDAPYKVEFISPKENTNTSRRAKFNQNRNTGANNIQFDDEFTKAPTGRGAFSHQPPPKSTTVGKRNQQNRKLPKKKTREFFEYNSE